MYYKISNSQKPKLADERFDTWAVYRPVYDKIHLLRLVPAYRGANGMESEFLCGIPYNKILEFGLEIDWLNKK